MSLEEKPMPRSLMTPGREDLSPWPPVGQLDFEQITGMREEQLDRAFKERHGLTSIFKQNKYDEPYAKDEGRRTEIKRLTLARLEGYSMGDNSQLADWFDSVAGESVDPGRLLAVTLHRVLNSDCKKRIHDVKTEVAREAKLLRPTSDVVKVEKLINQQLSKLGLPKLSVAEIINDAKIPSHRGVDWERALRAFLLEIQGLSEEETADSLNISVKALSVVKARHLSDAAKNAVRKVRGYKRETNNG